MQLPWNLIDYVLLHELAHTQVLRHGPDFWAALQAVLPDAKERRRKLQAYRPVLMWHNKTDGAYPYNSDRSQEQPA